MPASVLWAAVMCVVRAPLQETSVSVCPVLAAASRAKFLLERRQPSGESDWFGINGPAANESPRPTHSAAPADAGATANDEQRDDDGREPCALDYLPRR